VLLLDRLLLGFTDGDPPRLGVGPLGDAQLEHAVAVVRHDARRQVLLISGRSLRGQTSFHPQVARALRQLVDTVRPITNALPGGDLAQMDLVIIHLRHPVLLGSGGSGTAAWKAHLEEVGYSYGFGLHFPRVERKPRQGVHWEAQEATQGIGKVRACLVGDGRVSEDIRDAQCRGIQAAKIELRLVPRRRW
jgi:hypothetical protein